jgi:hypothetical protein
MQAFRQMAAIPGLAEVSSLRRQGCVGKQKYAQAEADSPPLSPLNQACPWRIFSRTGLH